MNLSQRISAVVAVTLGLVAALLGGIASWAGTAFAQAESITIRVGHFPNVTHVQALVARNFERQGTKWFAARLGSGVRIE